MTKVSTTPSYQANSLEPEPKSLLPALLLTLVIISIILLVIVGGGLFFFPTFSQPRWLWPLAPFNTRFLGAIYLTALVSLSESGAGKARGAHSPDYSNDVGVYDCCTYGVMLTASTIHR